MVYPTRPVTQKDKKPSKLQTSHGVQNLDKLETQRGDIAQSRWFDKTVSWTDGLNNPAAIHPSRMI